MKLVIEAEDLGSLLPVLKALEGYDLKVSYSYSGMTLTSKHPTDELTTKGAVLADLRKISDSAPDARALDISVRQYMEKLETGEEPF